jgi:hypothetical protein
MVEELVSIYLWTIFAADEVLKDKSDASDKNLMSDGTNDVTKFSY